jgi:hypothetical protein
MKEGVDSNTTAPIRSTASSPCSHCHGCKCGQRYVGIRTVQRIEKVDSCEAKPRLRLRSGLSWYMTQGGQNFAPHNLKTPNVRGTMGSH